MKSNFYSAFIFILFFFLPGVLKAESIALPSAESFTLDNGLKFFVVKDDLPKLNLIVSVGLGKLYEDQATAGVSDLLCQTVSLAGSKNYPGSVLYDQIEKLGGKFSINSSYERIQISFSILDKHLVQVFSIVKDLLENPLFPEKELATAKNLIIESLKREKDNPSYLAIKEIKKNIFLGKGYGAIPTEKLINSYDQKLLLSFWHRHFKAKNMLVGISSSHSIKSIQKKSRHFFASLNSGSPVDYFCDKKDLLKNITTNNDKIYFIPKNIPQATIIFGTVGPVLGEANNHPLTVMNYILGDGSFNSRLVKEIRVKRGLAYVVQSILRFRKKIGLFLALTMTSNEKVKVALPLLLDNIKQVELQGITHEELLWAQDSISNSFIFRFDSISNIIANALFLDYNHLPPDYYNDYIVKINEVTEKKVLEESQKLFKDGFIKVVLGRPSLQAELQKFGQVVLIEE